MSDFELESIPSGNEESDLLTAETMKSVHKGRASFLTAYEKSLLLDLVNEHKSVIECKKQDSMMNVRKQKAWKEIAANFNTDLHCTFRDEQQLRRGYENLKRRSKSEVGSVP